MIFTANINDQDYRAWSDGTVIDIEIPKVSYTVSAETVIKAKIQAIAGARFLQSFDNSETIVLRFGVEGGEEVRGNALRSLGQSDDRINEVVRPQMVNNKWPDDDAVMKPGKFNLEKFHKYMETAPKIAIPGLTPPPRK